MYADNSHKPQSCFGSSILGGDAVVAGENQCYRIEGFYFFIRKRERLDLAVNADFPYTSGYELVVLAPEIQDQHFLFAVLHMSVSESDLSVFYAVDYGQAVDVDSGFAELVAAALEAFLYGDSDTFE